MLYPSALLLPPDLIAEWEEVRRVHGRELARLRQVRCREKKKNEAEQGGGQELTVVDVPLHDELGEGVAPEGCLVPGLLELWLAAWCGSAAAT